jgi:uncharacterized protein
MVAVARDRSGLEILDRQECLQLLATAHVGRIALSLAALPVVLPVNFALLDDDVLIRTTPGSKLDAATKNTVVAFEADRIDALNRTGWSVLVQGVASEITDRDERDRAAQIPLTPWSGHDDHFVCVRSQLVSGRRLAPLAAPEAWPAAAYKVLDAGTDRPQHWH